MNDCVFCEILAGQRPASQVYQDDICTAFMDIRPVNPGHVLVIPNHHAAHLSELDEDTAAHIFTTGHRLALAMRKCGVKCEGVNLYLADGRAAGQEVFHLHLHIIPRFYGDGFGLKFDLARLIKPGRETLDEIAGWFRTALGSIRAASF